MSQLDAGLLYAMTGLKLGEMSKPVSFESQDGKSGYRIIKLVSESQPHVANLKDDYAKIQAVAKQAKQQEALLKCTQRKEKNDTYIFID
jgi:peptidyl-prolyl cis-trans isomerase SurA